MIGRNEGERLKAALAAIRGMPNIAYVDSGSTDGSQDHARAIGVEVVELPVPPKFTAARARNAGVEALLARNPMIDRIQMIDGDCVVERGWIAAASAALDADPRLAGVFGRRQEIAPDRSVYNRFCDNEWNTPIGPALATGGDAMFRVTALRQVGGYAPELIAGEEPDMCLRMGRHGWRFLRIDAPMTRHDANILRFGQWWQRARRAGYAATSHVLRHGRASLPGDIGQVVRMLLWGVALPALILLLLVLALVSSHFILAALLVLAIYPLQWLRQARSERASWPSVRGALAAGGLRVLHQFAAVSGLTSAVADCLVRRDRKIMEYR